MLEAGIRCSRIGTSSVVSSAGIFRGDELLVRGEMVYVFTGAVAEGEGGAPTSVPQQLRDALQAFEAGKPMVEVRVGSWKELGRDAGNIRTSVFIHEQKIPVELEWDEADAGCTHAVAYNRIGMPLATGRLLEHVPGVAKIGRMAVSQTVRGTGVGRKVLDALVKAAKDRGDREAVLHAQLTAVPFYARSGFTQRGPVFDEADIPHVEMVRTL
jgi:predicted GNAT family N-acyltransferase